MTKYFISFLAWIVLFSGVASAQMMNYGGPGWGMMGGASFWYWIVSLGALVWLIVGVLLIVWLWQRINKK